MASIEQLEQLSAASSALSEALSFAVPSVQSLSSAIDAAEGALSACDAAADALMRSETPDGALVDAVATIALAVEASASAADALSMNESALAALHDDLRAMLYRVLLAATRGLWALTRDGRPQAPTTSSPHADVPSRAVQTALRIALRAIDAEHDEGSRDSHEPTASLDVRDAAAAMSFRVLAAVARECSDPAARLLDAWKAVLADELRMAQLALSALQGTDPMPSSQYASAISRHEAAIRQIRQHETLLRAASAGEVGVLASRLLRGAEARVAVRLRRAREGQQVLHAERMVAAVLELLCSLCFAAAPNPAAAAVAAAPPEAATLASPAAMGRAQHGANGRGPPSHAPRRALAPCWASLVARVYLMSAASSTSASAEEELRLLRVQATNALGVLLGCTLPAETELATATALLDEHLPAPSVPNTAPVNPEAEASRSRGYIELEGIERALLLALRRVSTPTTAREVLARGAATWLLALHARAVPGGPLAPGPLAASMATPVDLADTDTDAGGALAVLSSLCSAAGAGHAGTRFPRRAAKRDALAIARSAMTRSAMRSSGGARGAAPACADVPGAAPGASEVLSSAGCCECSRCECSSCE